jgi:hypothetical protein
VALAVTAVLTGVAPAATVIASRRPPSLVVVTGHDFATTTKVRREVTPGTPGPTHFSASGTDYDSGRPLHATAVSLRLAPADRTDVPGATLSLRRAGAVWRADSPAISIAGRWSVTVVVQQASGGLEIPLRLSTAQPTQRVSVQRTAGLPVFYSITVGSRRVDTYVDPGHRGANEVHFTFYGASGDQDDVAVAAVTARGRPLVFRTLEPGHIVADVDITSGGKWRFGVRTADGLRAYFDQSF